MLIVSSLKDVGEGWWEGLDTYGNRGLFPAAYVKVCSKILYFFLIGSFGSPNHSLSKRVKRQLPLLLYNTFFHKCLNDVSKFFYFLYVSILQGWPRVDPVVL